MLSKNIQAGFTLIEVMIAMVVLVIGIIALYTMQMSSMHGNMRANLITNAATLNAGEVEQLIGRDFDDLEDSDGDGTDQDADGDGDDDNDLNFGLDDNTTATADGNTTTDDDKYQIFWNVALDVPFPNTKTIYVHVVDLNDVLSDPVTFMYMRGGSI